MLHRYILLLAVFTIVLAFSGTSPTLGGGPPSFSFEAPGASSGSAGSHPVLIVHAYSCHVPTDARVGAKAEGLVNGQRRSIPIDLKSTGQLGVYEVARQWPAEGSWVLVFSVDRGGQTTALVKLDATGDPIFEASPRASAAGRELSAKCLSTVPRKASDRDIDAVLTARVVK